MGFIYLVTNKINGKQYVGKTKFDINTRWIQHKSEAKRLKPNVHFIRALNKYGYDNFQVEELEKCPDENLFERERYYIKQYNTFQNGYNSTLGGEGNYKYQSDDILNLWNDGFTVNEIAKQIGCCPDTVSLTLRASGITSYEKRSRSMKKLSDTRKKEILQYDLNGNLINKFKCIEEVIKKTNYDESTIRSVCNHKRRSAYGFIWCHADETKSIQELIEELPMEKTKHSIAQYSLDGKLIATYDSIVNAARILNIHRSSIENALNNKSCQCQGYLWKYQDDNSNIMDKVIRNNNKKNYAKIPINQYDLNGNFLQTFDSAASAAIAINKPNGSSSITKACKGKLKTAYKFIWAYADKV